MAKIYIFHQNEYVRHSYGSGPDIGYPKKIKGFWSGWPDSWGDTQTNDGLYYPGNDKFYLFHGDEYVRHSYGGGPDVGYPKKIKDFWSGWPRGWSGLFFGAALYYPGNDKFYLFHEDEYVRHSYGGGPDVGYPKKIKDFWSGWPGSWSGIYFNAALYYPGNDKFYLFHGDEYVRHSYGGGPDVGYPKKIQGAWSGWPLEQWRDPPGEHLTRINAALYYPSI